MGGGGYDPIIKEHRPYILESYIYVNDDTERLLPYFGDFLLDSGAFSFMQGTKTAIDWNEYVDRYAEFIVRNKVEKFFEVDIDVVVGYDEVKRLRKRLEDAVGRRCIPVWHKMRGIDEFKRMCDEYEYSSIGGIVSGEIKKDQYKAFPYLIAEAHKRGSKIHGLGFTNLDWLPHCHFDSVDSTAWTSGNRFGFLYQFTGNGMRKIPIPKDKRMAKPREVALINYTEWIKFQKYAERNL